MRVQSWVQQLDSTGYRAAYPEESEEMINGITHGVDIEFTGDRNVTRECVNLPSATVDARTEAMVSDIIASDVRAGYKAGPFDRLEFPYYSLSPVGAVPKSGSTKIRMVNHLSHPWHGDSINASTVDKKCRLGSFEQAVGCPRIKPSVAAAHDLHGQLPHLEVGLVQVRDLQFTACRRP